MATKANRPDYEGEAKSLADAGGERSGGEALFPDLPRIKGKAILGKPIVIHEVHWVPSTENPGTEFAVMRVTLLGDKGAIGTLNDEPVTVKPGEEASTSTGGVAVCEQLRNMGLADGFPCKCQLRTVPGKQYWELAEVDAAE